MFLHADPPWDFTWSQDLFTDGARVVDGARNKVLYGSWIIDPRSPGAVFYPISCLIAWAIFKVAGVGLAQANVVGVLPALASLPVIYLLGKKIEGKTGGLLALVLLGFCYLHMIYSRVPMLESMLALSLLGAFWLALGGRLQLFFSGLIIGLTAFMVKLHVVHLLPVIIVYLLVVQSEALAGKRRSHLVGCLLAGFVVGSVIWLVTIYARHSGALNTYFNSNVVLAQDDDYQGLTLFKALQRRVAGVIHVGAGRDGYLAKTAEILIPGLFGLLGIGSRFSFRKPTLKPYELFAAIWFVGLIAALGLLSYRPLRYLALLTPSACLLALSLLMRLARGEPVIATPRPRWFIYVFGFWLGWMILHIQQEIVFQVMTGGRVVLVNEMNAFQKSLYAYQFMVFRHVLIYGGLALAITLFFHERISSGGAGLSLRGARRLFVTVVAIVIAAGTLRFAWYAADRKYSVVETGRSLTRVLSEGVLLVGDCSAIIALETDFKTLPSYGDLIRHEEKERFEQYPITHFILRFPTLFNYLSKTYPDFDTAATPVRIFGLCGREATIVRYDDWPGFKQAHYTPTPYEIGTMKLREEDIVGARRSFEEDLARNPGCYEDLWGLALCDYREGDYEDSQRTIEKALAITKRDALCFEAYADVLNSLGQVARSVEYYRKALEISPNSRRIARKLVALRGTSDD
jgi:hypothetical protein